MDQKARSELEQILKTAAGKPQEPAPTVHITGGQALFAGGDINIYNGVPARPAPTRSAGRRRRAPRRNPFRLLGALAIAALPLLAPGRGLTPTEAAVHAPYVASADFLDRLDCSTLEKLRGDCNPAQVANTLMGSRASAEGRPQFVRAL